MSVFSAFLLISIGLVACFRGKQYHRVVLAMFGFLLGYYVTAGLLTSQTQFIQGAVSVVVGIVLGGVFYTLYKFAYVLFGAFLGLFAAALLARALSMSEIVFVVVALLLTLTGGALGYFLADLMIRIATAFGGAIQVVAGVGALAATIGLSLPLVDLSHSSVTTATTTAGIISVVLAGILGVIGFVVQSQANAQEV